MAWKRTATGAYVRARAERGSEAKTTLVAAKVSSLEKVQLVDLRTRVQRLYPDLPISQSDVIRLGISALLGLDDEDLLTAIIRDVEGRKMFGEPDPEAEGTEAA